nr:ankyrin repeat domain-containing protein [Wolbachia endosymbiont of Pentalonia nigronervosa]
MDQHLTDTNIINAAANGYIEVVKYLIKQGADVNAQDKDGKTALHYAAANGHVDAVKCLIEQGVEVNAAESKNRRTALHYAVANGSLELLRYLLENLLEKGSDVDVKDKHEISPLRYAVAKGNVKVVRILLEYGADIKALDRRARSNLDALLTTEIEPYFTHTNIIHSAKQTARS